MRPSCPSRPGSSSDILGSTSAPRARGQAPAHTQTPDAFDWTMDAPVLVFLTRNDIYACTGGERRGTTYPAVHVQAGDENILPTDAVHHPIAVVCVMPPPPPLLYDGPRTHGQHGRIDLFEQSVFTCVRNRTESHGSFVVFLRTHTHVTPCTGIHLHVCGDLTHGPWYACTFCEHAHSDESVKARCVGRVPRENALHVGWPGVGVYATKVFVQCTPKKGLSIHDSKMTTTQTHTHTQDCGRDTMQRHTHKAVKNAKA